MTRTETATRSLRPRRTYCNRDKQLKEKIVLFVDSCTAHPRLTNLRNSQLDEEYSILIQTMDQKSGISSISTEKQIRMILKETKQEL